MSFSSDRKPHFFKQGESKRVPLKPLGAPAVGVRALGVDLTNAKPDPDLAKKLEAEKKLQKQLKDETVQAQQDRVTTFVCAKMW